MIYVLILQIFLKLKLNFLIIYFIKKNIVKVNNPKAKKKYNILMLSFEKFRGDVSELSKRDDLEVYKISISY